MRSPKTTVKKSQAQSKGARSKGLHLSAPSVGAAKGAKRPVATAAGVVICDTCKAVYYDKHWHSRSLVASWLDLKGAAIGRCEACRGGKQYAGEIVLEGLKDSLERDEILHLIRRVGKRAQLRNAEARVIGIEVTGARVRVTTTDNQLAVAIGKQIHEARKGSQLQVTWSSGDKPVRVIWRKLA